VELESATGVGSSSIVTVAFNGEGAA